MSEADVGRALSGRYRLDSRLGEGGMGVVYAGVDQVLERPIAVKLLRGCDHPSAQERFFREAKIMAMLSHPSIVQIFDFGCSDAGEPFLVMERVEGQSLDVLLETGEPLSLADTLSIACSIARALHVAHDAGIVHRDLKPANVIVRMTGSDGPQIKLLDFGIAKLTAPNAHEITQGGEFLGTLVSMAPEQIRGEAVDARTDVYALGCVLYEMLVGQSAFEGSAPAAVLQKHLTLVPKPPSVASGRTDISIALDQIILKCLEKAAEDRYASAALVLAQLEIERARVTGTAAEVPSLGKPIPTAAWVVSPSRSEREPAHVAKLPQSGLLDFDEDDALASLEVDDARSRSTSHGPDAPAVKARMHAPAGAIVPAAVGYGAVGTQAASPAALAPKTETLAPELSERHVPEEQDEEEEPTGALVVFYAVPEAIHKRLCVWGFGLAVLVAFLSGPGFTSTTLVLASIYGTIGWILQARRTARLLP